MFQRKIFMARRSMRRWIILIFTLLIGQLAVALAATAQDSFVTEKNLPAEDANAGTLLVCHRPLPKWAGSRNFLLRALYKFGVRHIHHSYIDFSQQVVVPGTAMTFRTVGIHPVGPSNHDKEPLPDQITDTLVIGGECKPVKDVTEEKLQRLINEIAADMCYSCGKNYHNHVLTGCYNNSNTYVYDLIVGSGMTPPSMRGTPGYRRHHTCHL
jgi:hypothetical protein